MYISLPRIDQPSLRERTYRVLRDRIISSAIAPGERVDLEAIEDQLGISRTPLKEALLQLEIDGLVRIVPRAGTYVTDPSPQEISDSFDVRTALEVYAIGVVARQLTKSDFVELREMVTKLGELASTDDRDAIYPQYLELDHRFHGCIVSLAGNKRLEEAHTRENTHAQMGRIRYGRSERDLEQAQKEHEQIVAALAARDQEAAKAAMDAHLTRAKRSLLSEK